MAGMILGAAIGVGATLGIRGGDSTTKRTAPEIVKALLATECEADPSYRTIFIAPVRANDGDWYTGCVSLLGSPPKSFFNCYRVKADTLEVIQMAGGPEGQACATLSGWPKP